MDPDAKKALKIGSAIVIVVLLFIFLIASISVISPGERGVVVLFGKITGTIDPGFHFLNPFAVVSKLNVQTQKEQKDTEAASSDLQDVKTTVAVNYHIDPSKVATLYQNVGDGYNATIIDPAIQEAVKASTAKYTAEELVTKREAVKDDVQAALTTRLAQNDILVDNISIVNFSFSDSFNQAIEAKVTAEQNALAAKNKLAQVQYEADQRVAEAQGEAKAIAIQAQAITSQGGPEYVKLQAIQKWNGTLPQYMLGNTVPFINVGQ